MPTPKLQKGKLPPSAQAARRAPAGSVDGSAAGSQHGTSAYEIMASRIANRIAEMAESLTVVERPSAMANAQLLQYANVAGAGGGRRPTPRKLEIRLPSSGPETVSFSAPFLDNTLSKMLSLQSRMLKSGTELVKAGGVSDDAKREHFAQSSELSKIIALICAEKARQGG